MPNLAPLLTLLGPPFGDLNVLKAPDHVADWRFSLSDGTHRKPPYHGGSRHLTLGRIEFRALLPFLNVLIRTQSALSSYV